MEDYYFTHGDYNPLTWDTTDFASAGIGEPDFSQIEPDLGLHLMTDDLITRDFGQFMQVNALKLAGPATPGGVEDIPMPSMSAIDTGNSDDDRDDGGNEYDLPPPKRRAILVIDDDDEEEDEPAVAPVRRPGMSNVKPTNVRRRERVAGASMSPERPVAVDLSTGVDRVPKKKRQGARTRGYLEQGDNWTTPQRNVADPREAIGQWSEQAIEDRIERLRRQLIQARRDVRNVKARQPSSDELAPVDCISHRSTTVVIYAADRIERRAAAALAVLTSAVYRMRLPILVALHRISTRLAQFDSMSDPPGGATKLNIWQRARVISDANITRETGLRIADMIQYEQKNFSRAPSLDRPALLFVFYVLQIVAQDNNGNEREGSAAKPTATSPVKRVYDICAKMFGSQFEDNGPAWGQTYSLAMMMPESFAFYTTRYLTKLNSSMPQNSSLHSLMMQTFGTVPVSTPSSSWLLYATPRFLTDHALESVPVDDETWPYATNLAATTYERTGATNSMVLARSKAKSVRFAPMVRVKTFNVQASDAVT